MNSTSGRRARPVQGQPLLFNDAGDKAPPIPPKMPWVPLEVPRDVEAGLRLMDEPDVIYSSPILTEEPVTQAPNSGDLKPYVENAYQLELLRSDAIVRCSPHHGAKKKGGGKRGDVVQKEMSFRSRQRLGLFGSNCVPELKTIITATMSPLVNIAYGVEKHKRVIKTMMDRLRDRGSSGVWVREFQNNRSVHTHTFTSDETTPTGQGELEHVDVHQSREWSEWLTLQYSREPFTGCELCAAGRYAECESAGGVCGEAFRKMASPRTQNHVGCVRVERLYQQEAVGRYLCKEMHKRNQKQCFDRRWKGRWWGKFGEIYVPDGELVVVSGDELTKCKIALENGKELERAYGIQYGLAAKIRAERETSQHGTDGER